MFPGAKNTKQDPYARSFTTTFHQFIENTITPTILVMAFAIRIASSASLISWLALKLLANLPHWKNAQASCGEIFFTMLQGVVVAVYGMFWHARQCQASIAHSCHESTALLYRTANGWMDGWILKTLRAAAGERWGDVAYLLGERSRRKDANSGKLLFGKRDD